MCVCVAKRIVIQYTGAARGYIAGIHDTEFVALFAEVFVALCVELCVELFVALHVEFFVELFAALFVEFFSNFFLIVFRILCPIAREFFIELFVAFFVHCPSLCVHSFVIMLVTLVCRDLSVCLS